MTKHLGFALILSTLAILPLHASAFDLLGYVQQTAVAHSHQGDAGIIPYNRTQQFGGWINETPQTGCYNTRARVLMRDSANASATQFESNNACIVYQSQWNEPYTGQTYELASAMQIDHVVPLENIYYAGAYTWSQNRRCHYANDLDNNFQLLAVNGSENMRKGDRGPDGYMPPNRAFQCQYLHIWMEVHAIWDLESTASEVQAIESYLQQDGCGTDTTTADDNEITLQRQLSQRNVARCPQE